MHCVVSQDIQKRRAFHKISLQSIYHTFSVDMIFGPTDFGGWSYRLTPVRSFVRPSVRSFVCPDFFSITGHRIFLIFCMKLDMDKGLKVTEPDFPKKIRIIQ